MGSEKAVQIITHKNHEFKLRIEELKKIFHHDDIKERKVVTVAVSGAFRKGKSFLLNFFLKYLYAQYKSHDVSDWIGENNSNNELTGFISRGGPDRQTTGIWIWSDMFTHDFDNGNKVAIIVMDTQGIFDNKSSVKDCTAIFAISMMMSSVQCYNVTQNIQEDDLQNLELFTEYGRLASQQTIEKPFQKLLFIVRDWFYAKQYNFGNGKKFIDEKLSENEEQTLEMRQIRERIRKSFLNIDAFLMPFPGSVVAQGEITNGNFQQIEPQFIATVKQLVPSLFAPENLIVKRINGQKLRAGDLLTYLESYVNIFNSDTLPEPKTVLRATAEANNQILHNECLRHYVESMEKSLIAVSFFTAPDLQETHDKAKEASLSQFDRQGKLGDDQLIQSFHCKLQDHIELKLKSFETMNNRQQNDYLAKKAAEAEARHQAQLKALAEERERIANEEARRQAQLKMEANERERIANEEARRQAQLKMEADERERIANEEARRQAQLKMESDERERIANEEANRQAQLKVEAFERERMANQLRAEAEERARIAEQERIRIEKEIQKGKKLTLGNIVTSVGAVVTGAFIGGPVGAAAGLAAAGAIIDK